MSRLAKSFVLFLSFVGLLLSATNAMAATYTWVGVASASWATSTNWSPTRTTPAVTDVLQFSSGGTATPTAVPTQTIGQLIISNNTAVTLTTQAANRTLSVGQGIAGTDLNVQSGSSLTLVSGSGTFTLNYTAGQTGTTGSIAGILTVNASTVWNVTTGTTSTTSVAGTVTNAGTITGSAATLTFASTGIYLHNFTATNGVIPTATWSAGSTCRIIGYTTATGGLAGLGYNQTFSNFEWNAPNQTATFSTNGALTTVNGNFTVTNTNTGTFSLGAAVAGNLAIGGNFSQTGGTFLGSSSNARTITTTGSFSLSGGTFNLSSSATVANAVTVTVGTDFTHSAGTLTESGATTGSGIIFPLGSHNYTSGGTVSNVVNFTVNNGSTLQMAAATTAVTGGGAFTLSSGGTLGVTSTAGITATGGGAVGNIQVTGTRSYNTGANYTYNNATPAAQVTGSGLPATVNNFTVNNASGVTLSGSVTVSGTLALTSGVLTTTTFTVITSASCLVPSVTRISGWVNGNLQLNFPTGTPSCTFPVGDATTYRPIDMLFASVTTAGSLIGSQPGAVDHPNIATSGLDSTKDVNRYWTITKPAASTIAYTTYSATFTFVPATSGVVCNGTGDCDSGANQSNFEVEASLGSGATWTTTTIGTRTATSTQASGISVPSITNTYYDFAVGEKKPTNPGGFESYETTTTCTPGVSYNCLTGSLHTKIAGMSFTFDIAALNPAKTALFTTFVGPVKVELLDASSGGLLDANACNAGWTLIQKLSDQTFNAAGDLVITGASGRHRVTPAVTENNAWRNVAVRVTYPATGSATAIGCSTDHFAIRPSSLVIIQSDGVSFGVTDSNWQTAGIARTLNNSGATGGNVHKAGQPFTISATAQNAVGATTTNYAGSPTVKTLACTLPTPTCTNGTLTPGAWSGSGTVTTSTASYNEAGAFNLTLEDQTFSSVDNADSTLLERTIPQVAAVAVGRFVPDHFDVAVLITPTFKTFNAADAACSAGAAPRRTFTYIGQPFGYLTAPQATIRACNTTATCSTPLTTTTNYKGGLWKVAASDITQTYSNNAVGPSLDTTQIVAPLVTDNLNGTGTVASAAADKLAYQRSIAAPIALFNANLSLTVSAQDASENVANQGIITSTTTALFNGAGSGIDFDGGGTSNGKEFRYGRLRLSNSLGSELLNLLVPIQTQYWNSAAFVTNVDDNCTVLNSANIALGNYQRKTGDTWTTLPTLVNTVAVQGAWQVSLSKPTATFTGKGSVDLCVDLGADPVGGTVCSATSASLPYLQGLWSPGTSYNNDPGARATFGVYKGGNEFIYLRENY